MSSNTLFRTVPELVGDCKAVKDREKSTRKTIVRIECGTGGFCWCVSWDDKTTQTPCVGEVPSEDGSRTESTLGEGQSETYCTVVRQSLSWRD